MVLQGKDALPRLGTPTVSSKESLNPPPPTHTHMHCRHVEILPLSTGCLGACTYCKTKHARGERVCV